MGISDAPQVISVEQAGKILGIGRRAAYLAAKRGDIPIIRIGRSVRVPIVALEEMLKVRPHHHGE